MKVFVVYDSMYGNTEAIALAIASVFPNGEANLVQVDNVKMSDLISANLLIVGSPTHGGRPKPSVQMFLDNISSASLEGKKVAAFDTRFLAQEQGFGLRIIMGIIGYAAPKILASLKSKGGIPIAAPEGFIVTGKKGEIKSGEKERAMEWARNILSLV